MTDRTPARRSTALPIPADGIASRTPEPFAPSPPAPGAAIGVISISRREEKRARRRTDAAMRKFWTASCEAFAEELGWTHQLRCSWVTSRMPIWPARNVAVGKRSITNEQCAALRLWTAAGKPGGHELIALLGAWVVAGRPGLHAHPDVVRHSHCLDVPPGRAVERFLHSLPASHSIRQSGYSLPRCDDERCCVRASSSRPPLRRAGGAACEQ